MIAPSPNFHKDGVCFAANDQGLYKTQDGCQTWENTFDVISKGTTLSCTSVALSPDYEKDNMLFAGVKGGVLVSKDKAASWQVIELPTPQPIISRIMPSPGFSTDNKVFAATTDDGVYLSDNRGLNWKTWNFGLFDLNIYDLVVSPGFMNDQTLYLGTETGIFISKNGGCSWQDSAFPIENGAVLSLTVSNMQDNMHYIYAGTEKNGLYLSKDRGKHWECLIDRRINGTINQVLVEDSENISPKVTTLLADRIIESSINSENWKTLYTAEKDASSLSCIAPLGIDQDGHHFLVGTLGNGLIQI